MQHIVFNVEDELFTLRERFDYVLIGGDGADAPLSEDTARELAITLLELGASAILQLNDFGLAGQRRVIAAFLSGLMKAPRPLWHPVLVTLDEAHRYAPQSASVESSEAIMQPRSRVSPRPSNGFAALSLTPRRCAFLTLSMSLARVVARRRRPCIPNPSNTPRCSPKL
jgi:hypothetical protein